MMVHLTVTRRLLIGLPLLLLLSSCGFKIPKWNYGQLKDCSKRGLVLGPGDRISINVWGHNDLNTTATIRPDGIVTMPLVGDIVARDKTSPELRNVIKRKLVNYIKDANPNVQVSVLTYNSYRFTVTGAVGRPGTIRSREFVSVQEALTMAGGPNRFAKADEIIITRTEGKTVHRIPISYPAILTGKHSEMNFTICRGDIIHVP
jgi:polysaccharide export outer membrane protein